MSRLLRRIQQLELRLTDRSGLVPHAQQWQDHWWPRVDAIITKSDVVAPSSMPLAVVDAILAAIAESR